MFDISLFEVLLEEVAVTWSVLFGGLLLAFLFGRFSQRRLLEKQFRQQNKLMEQLKQQSSHILAALGETEYEAFEPEAQEETDQAVEPSDDPLSETKIYVGNVDYNATEEELADHFSHFGEIEFVNIPVHRHTHRARGFGFIAFKSQKAAQQAINLDDTEFRGRQIQVNFAKER